MAKKSSSKKSLKSLFSRSEANLDESVEKDASRSGGEKKKFKFPKLKTKWKNGPGSERPDLGGQQVLSAAESPAEDEEAWTVNKRSAIYNTTPRSKSKEFSYSELDLRKPKRFATFSFGFRKKKKKEDEDNISKSTFGLHRPGIEEQEETNLDLSQMALDQANAKTVLSMSQPELDTSETFDIPSPPAVATNQSGSYFTLPNQPQMLVTGNTQPESKESPMNSSRRLDVGEEAPKAPLASIPELQLDDEKFHNPAHHNSLTKASEFPAPVTHAESICVVDTRAAPSLPASQPPVALDTSDPDAASQVDPCDKNILREPYTKTEIFLTESTSVTLFPDQPDAPDRSDGTAPSGEPSLTIVPRDDNDNSACSADSSAVPEKIAVSHTERFVPEAVTSVTTTSATGSEKSTPYSEEAVYGALYESLFPRSFTSEILSSLSNHPPQIYTEVKHPNTKPEPVMVKTLNKLHEETSVTYSRLPSSHDFAARGADEARRSYTNTQADFKVAPRSEGRFVSYKYSAATDLQADAHTQPKCLFPSNSSASEAAGKFLPYSERTHSQSEVKSDSFSLVADTLKSVYTVPASAPPVSEYVTSQGTGTQVTDSKRRVILVKELVCEEPGVDSGCPSPVPDKMSTINDLELKIETRENIYAPFGSGLAEACEGPLSPVYLSVGSDDGSAMEIYYSAEEDNAEDSGEEEMYTMDEKEEPNGVKEIAERGGSMRDEGDSREVTGQMQNERGIMGNEEELKTEVQWQPRGQVIEAGPPEFLVSSDANRKEREVETTELLQVKEEREEEGGGEELLATPVQQVNTLVACKVAPPSGEQHVQGEWSDGNWTTDMGTEDPLKGEKQLPSQEIRYPSFKDLGGVDCIDAAPSNTREEDVLTPSREAREQVSLTGDKKGEAGKETNSSATTSAGGDAPTGAEVVMGVFTHNAEPQSDAAEREHNRAVQSNEWADTATLSSGRKGTAQEQAAVELSNSNPDAHRREPAEAISERHEHPAEAQADLKQGSLIASSPRAAASESQQTNTDRGLVDKMNPGYSSLSTKLTLRTLSPPKEDESKNRFHKVSLIAEGDTVDSTKTMSTVTESNGTDLGSEYRWRNRFEGVSQYQPLQMEDFSFSHSLRNMESDTSSLSSSALPEATAYKPLSYTSSSFSSSLTQEEHFTPSGNRLSDRTEVYLSRESVTEVEPKYEWRRSLVQQEEPAAPVAEREGEAESDRIKSRWDSQRLPVSGFSSALQTSSTDGLGQENDDDSTRFTGLFTATLVELDPAAPPSTPPASPDIDSPHFDMDTLMDTLKSMGPSLRPRSLGPRPPPQGLVSSLPPIVEDAPSPVTADIPASITSPTKKVETPSAESHNGVYLLPADLGLKRSSSRDTRSPLELMKQQQQEQSGARGLNLPLRSSATSSIVMRKSSDSSSEDLKSPVLNGNGLLSPPNTGSRLDNSVIFGAYRSSSIDQTAENGKAPRLIYRTGSLPDTSPLSDRMSIGLKEHSELSPAKEPVGSRFERFSFLLNSPSSTSGSLTVAEDHNTRMSRPPPLSISSPPSSNSPTRLLSPTGSIGLHGPLTTADSPLSLFGQTHGMGTPILQRSFTGEGTAGVQQTSLFSGSQFQSKEPEPDRNLMSKYRAFPDAYLTKEKEHGKLNPRPGKMYIFDRPGMCGQRIEVRSDVIDATPWELQETISIRVVRGGWVLYEKPNFKGDKIALDEGDIELAYPFNPPEEHLQNGQKEGEASDEQTETKPARKFIIGSLRRAVRDYSVPEISLFPEENAEGKKVIFRDTSEDARIFGFPIKANSIIINAGLWLVYAQPFFQGVPRVLEVGGYSNPAAWGVEQPYVGSLHPLKVGEPRVENMHEPKMVIYDKPYFCGKSRTITANMKDFMTRADRQQTVFMYSVGSLKVLGGIWVGYEKEGFRGHQYLLEEGEYHDWRVWGGRDAELRSVRVIRADLTDPLMVMFEQPEEDQEGMQENTFEVTEAIPDVELFEYKTSTRSINVISGAWVAYSHVDFSGDQYILEKGFYNNCADWGSQDTHICSVQPILLAPSDSLRSRSEIILYSEQDFLGECHIFDRNQDSVSEKYPINSCRVVGGSWVLYENQQYSGNMYVLSEGEYPNLTSMGCRLDSTVRSVKVVPTTFSVPSISLFGLECLEGREITTDTEIINMAEEGLNNHILSVRVNSGSWVICEHSNYRGRQFLLEQIEITNWPKFSSLQTIGSMYPVRQKRHFFHIKNKESGHYMSVQGGVEEMKSGRVVATAEVEPMSDIWFYQDGFIKNKLSTNMCLQVMGSIEPAAKVVLWTETRQPVQTWTAKMRGLITSLTFPGMVLDVKGGKTYDKDHVVIMPENEERPSQQWIIELL